MEEYRAVSQYNCGSLPAESITTLTSYMLDKSRQKNIYFSLGESFQIFSVGIPVTALARWQTWDRYLWSEK